MITRLGLTGRLKKLGVLLEYHFKMQGYKYDEELNPFRYSSRQFYNVLELSCHIDLKHRLEVMQKMHNKENPLTTKTKLKSLNYIDVIMEANEEIQNKAIEILTKLIERYNQDVFTIDIDLDDKEEQLFLDSL